MFIEMIDLLRCVNAHEDTWLVASFSEVTNRIVTRGTLGCPVCSAEYPIQDGVADFTLGESSPSFEDERASAGHRREELATRAGRVSQCDAARSHDCAGRALGVRRSGAGGNGGRAGARDQLSERIEGVGEGGSDQSGNRDSAGIELSAGRGARCVVSEFHC